MSEFLTSKQLQAILDVDRTTIYRMAERGQLPAVKVGGQWRFPRQPLDAWLQAAAGNGRAAPAEAQPLAAVLPLACVQMIQDGFADLLGVMVLMTDMNGQLLTTPSNACGLFTLVDASPASRQRCLALWSRIANEPALRPRFLESHIGLLCARGLIRVGSEIKAMVVAGGIAPSVWPPDPERLQQMADDLDLPVQLLQQHLHEVHHLPAEEHSRVLAFVQRIADIFAHIIKERLELTGHSQPLALTTRS